MIDQIEVIEGGEGAPKEIKSLWIKPSLERLSLKAALTGNNGGNTDGGTVNNKIYS